MPASTATPTAAPPTATPTASHTPSATPTGTPTPEAIAAAPLVSGEDSNNSPSGDSPSTATAVEPEASPDGRSLLLTAGGILAALAAVYVGTYLAQTANVARYHDDFPLDICPVCEQGALVLDQRRYRVLGIPRVRRVIRCGNCRSVLRQVGRGRWRYAVDGAANPALFERLNGRIVTETQLKEISPEYRGAPPEYIEGDDLPRN